eukprot:TRINITY_DN5901_c1_g1_i2.p1 TRINITY_DN5901_c1_g1~~TRINITY_DN5901_c1_g1_i2.p1  ORF type:complete len:471 (+),score=82.57 TRINITY_DN5901_c1_g1_i2:157-1569(+)
MAPASVLITEKPQGAPRAPILARSPRTTGGFSWKSPNPGAGCKAWNASACTSVGSESDSWVLAITGCQSLTTTASSLGESSGLVASSSDGKSLETSGSATTSQFVELSVPVAVARPRFQAGDGANWEMFIENVTKAASQQRAAAAARARERWRSTSGVGAAEDPTVVAGIVLLYVTRCNPMSLAEVAVLRHAKMTVEQAAFTVVVGTVVIPHSATALEESGVPAEQRLSFARRVELARLILREETSIIVEPCMEGCLRGYRGRVAPLLNTYVRARLRNASVEPHVIEVKLEDPCCSRRIDNFFQIRAGAPSLLSSPVAPVGTSSGVGAEGNHGGAVAAKGSRRDSARLGALSLSSGASASGGYDLSQARTTPATPGRAISADAARGTTGCSSLSPNMKAIESVIVDFPKRAYFEDLLLTALQKPIDYANFDILERLCGREVAMKLRASAKHRACGGVMASQRAEQRLPRA